MVRMMRRSWLAVALAAVAGAACERPPEPPLDARVVYDTLDGVVHVVSGARGDWHRGGSWNVDRDGVTIGLVDGPEEYTFGQVAALVIGQDGRIYVGDAQANEVRVFSADGAFVDRFGRAGEGPGEFRNISGLSRAPEGIAVLDGRLARVTVFRPDGSVARSFRLERPYMRMEHRALMRFDRQGRFYDRTALAMQPMVDDAGIVVYHSGGSPVDTVRVAVIEQDHLVVERNGLPIMSFARPFAPQPSMAVGPDGRIYFARGDDYRITVRAPGGDTLHVIRRRVQPRPVPTQEREAALTLVRERFHESGAQPPARIDLPDTKPVIADLVVDDPGNLWVLTHGDPDWSHFEWAIHEPGGRYLGAVAMPRMRVMHIGADRVAGVTTDELGVQRVVVLKITKAQYHYSTTATAAPPPRGA
jgi:hypothetical protein